jgi:L-lysine 2,3-aminomutase
VPSGDARKRNQAWLWNYLEGRGCDLCGESNPIVLEFDHRNTLEKNYAVSQMVGKGYALEAIKEEVDKCDILCVYCHRIKTAKDQRWYSKWIDWDDWKDWSQYVFKSEISY